MLIALTLCVACVASVSAFVGPERLVSSTVDDAPSSPVAAAVAGAVLELNGPIGIVNDQGMTSKEFRESLQHVEEKGLRRVVLDLAVPAGREDSIAGYLQEIKSAQESGVEVFAFVRAATADGWCIALSCDRWACTEAARESLLELLKAASSDQNSKGAGGFQGRRKPPAGGGQMPGMGQGLGLSGSGEGAGDGSGDGSTGGGGSWSDGTDGGSRSRRRTGGAATGAEAEAIKVLDEARIGEAPSTYQAGEVFYVGDVTFEVELRDPRGASAAVPAEGTQ